MKRVGLLVILLVTLLFSVSFVFAGDPEQFRDHCTTSGCYILSCGSSPADISYIINSGANPKCVWTGTYCDGDVIKNKINGGKPSDLPGGVHNDCRRPNQWPYSCTYTIDDCGSRGLPCIDDGVNPAYCCIPKTCADFFGDVNQCGSNFDDGCGGTIDCLAQTNAVCNGDPGQYECTETYYSNCDGDWSNGCESDLNIDSDNCGACGDSCFEGYSCLNGLCSGNEWRNLNNIAITGADIEDYVKMYSPYAGAGRHYTIKHGDEVIDDDYPNDFFYIDKNYPNGLTFKVNGISNLYSNSLTIRTGGSSGGDDSLLIEWINPPCAEAFDKGTVLNIEFKVLDDDDMVVGNLTANGAVVKSFNNLYDGPHIIIPYTTTSQGNLQFMVYANNTRGKKYKAVSNVMVYDSSSSSEQRMVAACIDAPMNFDVFNTQFVDFDASSSRGLVYENGAFDWILPDELYFEWDFVYYGRTQRGSCEGWGRESCEGDYSPGGKTYLFTKIFPTVNDNYAYLSVSMP